MFKTMLTLMRGTVAAAEEEFADHNAPALLDQQIRESAAAIEGSKRALALAIAQDDAEGRRLDTTLRRIADLEGRAVAALSAGRDDLAGEAAEAIAVMEADRDAIRAARAAFADDARHLKAVVANAGLRLAELERGRRIALAAEAVRRLKVSNGPRGEAGLSTLAEAERTLKRLRERQAESAAADAAYDTLAPGLDPASTADRLEAAGFGRKTRPNAADVLSRLRAQAGRNTPCPDNASPSNA
jgi:phage shock protein A